MILNITESRDEDREPLVVMSCQLSGKTVIGLGVTITDAVRDVILRIEGTDGGHNSLRELHDVIIAMGVAIK